MSYALTGSAAAGTAALKGETGIVIPVFFPELEGGRDEVAVELLRDTVHSCLENVLEPESVCLSVDGERHGAEIAAELGSRLGVSVVVIDSNRGKLWALRHGMKELLPRPSLQYFAVVDADGVYFSGKGRAVKAFDQLAPAGIEHDVERGRHGHQIAGGYGPDNGPGNFT